MLNPKQSNLKGTKVLLLKEGYSFVIIKLQDRFYEDLLCSGVKETNANTEEQ